MRNRLIRMQLLVTLLLGLAAVPLLAQTSESGAITGTVKDTTGAVISTANVTITSLGTGQKRSVTTGDTGIYNFTLLAPGSYSLAIEAKGFKKLTVSPITVVVTETVALNNVLTVGAATQEVTVEASEVEEIQTASATVGTVLDEATVSELPLSTRNYTNLLGLSAGASSSVNNATSLGSGNTIIAVNGGDQYGNNFQMDGTPIDNFSSNATTETGAYGAFAIPNPDTIEEFKIQTANYDASYGRNAGGNVNVVTRSGTNQFHGTIFEFFRDTIMDANDFFNKYTQLTNNQPNTAQTLNENQFGATFGGPAIKNKLFVFAAYQETRQKNGATPYGYQTGVYLPTLPTGDRSTGAFKQALGADYCNMPSFGEEIGAYIPPPFPFQPTRVACDGSNINPVALNILNLKLGNGNYYVPGATGSGPASFSIPAIYIQHQAMANGDYNINQKNVLSARYFYESQPTKAPFPSGLGFPAPGVPGNPISQNFGYDVATLKLVSAVTPHLVNEARLGYVLATITATNDIPFTDAQVGITPVQPTSTVLSNIWFLPIGSSVTFDIGAHPFFGNNSAINQYDGGDQISWSHRQHQFSAGAEYHDSQWNWAFHSLSTGTMIFPTFEDFLIGLPQGISPFPGYTNTFLSSIVSEPNFTTRSVNAELNHWYRRSGGAFYLQDDYKVNSSLTLNLGVRWEREGQFFEKYGEQSNLDLDTIGAAGSIQSAGLAGTFVGYKVPANYPANGPTLPAGVGKYSTNGVYPGVPWSQFVPRVGFSWQPMKSSSLVIHAGGGMFYDQTMGNTLMQSAEQSGPYAYTIGYNPSQISLANPWDPTKPGWNAPRVLYQDLKSGAITNSGLDVSITMPYIKTPLTYAWNANVQYEFLHNWVLEAGYSGSHGIRESLLNAYPVNWAPLASASVPINGITTNTATNAALRAPYPGILGTDTGTVTWGSEKYNALLMTVRTQSYHGLQMQANYTYAHALNLGSEDTNPDWVHFDPTSSAPNHLVYAKNTYYTPNRFTMNFHYMLPFSEQGDALHKIFGGWSLLGIWVWQDGNPMTITDGTSGNAYFGATNGNVRPPAQFASGKGAKDILAGGSMFNRVFKGYFNASAFCVATQASCPTNLGGGTTGWGNSGYNPVLAPGQDNLDGTLERSVQVGGLRENATLEFRAEFFNVFNHPQFSNPNNDVSTGPTFGQITGTSVNPRITQLVLKYTF